ncbi:MAG: bifunctional folylpolyglutamate synthase/dihydrofolate synthase [Deltaproteobacteria bacterium]|jgi:dihydrofolate synthase / folylpolyglutamate synthase|nr:bifunctional folylpolyglutamate synthase/dihydrofolate synthase [Deltaproteobacteria bacterium]
MSYKNTIDYLESLRPKGFHMELGPLQEACSLMNVPQEAFPSIHVGGTNGKGSTAAFLVDILKYSGYKVGLFTSPHLIDVRERIQINRKLISEKDMAEIVDDIKKTLPDAKMLSYFEILALASFVHFKRDKVDIAVFETGLGGRLDATNVIMPKVAILTPISFDHMHHLGKTLPDIAREKCGIIKRGVPTVTAFQVPEVMDVIKRACDDAGSPLCIATPDEIDEPLGLAGEHQRQNAACAVEAAHLLSSSGITIKKIGETLGKTTWPGRLETVFTDPKVILDAAHNVAGAESLASYVRTNIKKEKAVLILGVLADKDLPGIVRPLAPLFREIVCVRAPSDRAASPKDLAAAARSSGAKIGINENISDAIKKLTKSMGKDETLVISGSLTVVGEAKGYFKNK